MKQLLFFTTLLLILLPISTQAQHKLDSLKSLMDNADNIAIRSEAGLLYADLILSSSYDSSLWAVDLVIKDCETHKYNQGTAKAMLSKSWLLLIKIQYEEALRYAHKALSIQEKEGSDTLGIGKALGMLGIIHLEYGQTEKAKPYLEQALTLFLSIKDTTRIDRAFNNLGVLSSDLEQFDEAIAYYKQSRILRIKLKDNNRVAYSNFNIGYTFLKKEELDSAGYYLNRSIEIFTKHTKKGKVPDMVYLAVGQYYMATKEYEKALININIGLKMALDLGHSDRWVWGYDLLSESLYKSGQFKESYDVLKKRAILADSINKATNAVAIAEIEEQYQNAKTEKKLMQALTENLKQENRIIKMRSYNIYILVVALILILISISYYWYKIQKKKVLEASLHATLSSTKLIALRSQIDSHFIFNCINTAQHFVIHSDNKKAYDYLSKFARLLRKVLDNSDLLYIPLEDELDLIKIYITLETIRFNNQFSFNLKIDPELENEVFEIPSMIIQPFIENAITHGLINLNNKQGQLNLTLLKKNTHIYCSIDDNGVGRKKAEKIKRHKEQRYKSQALSNAGKRLHLFNQGKTETIQFEILDLFDTEGNAAGTKVNIRLPFK